MATSSLYGAPWRRRIATLCALSLGTGSALAMLLAASAATAAPPRRALTQAPGFYRFELGELEITALSDGTVPQQVEALVRGTAAEHVTKLLERAYRTTPLETSVNAFLVNTGQKLVLIDTGVGDLMGPGAGGELASNLRAAGVKARDVDMVLLTHLHPDHIGGLVQEGKIMFPEATVHLDALEAGFWLSAKNRQDAPEELKPRFDEAVAMLEPYRAAGRLRPFEGDTPLTPGVRARPAYGHTPGHTVYEVTSGKAKLIAWGDVVHFEPLQLPEPGITLVYDVDPAAAAQQRVQSFAQAADQRYLVALAHLSFPGIGQIRREQGGYGWLPVDYDRRLGAPK